MQLIGIIIGFIIIRAIIRSITNKRNTSTETNQVPRQTNSRSNPQREAQKASLRNFTSMSQLPDDPALLRELRQDFLNAGDKERAFVCKMKLQELGYNP